MATLLKDKFEQWEKTCNERLETVKKNETEINRELIELYGLTGEEDPEVLDQQITIRKADLTNDIKDLVSYSIGCMFGRYSLDEEGIVYAGGEWNPDKYKTFPSDKDNIIPICDDEYFEDDITNRFVDFVRTVYGEETLEENLRFISTALGNNGNSREAIRAYFVNGFYSDHVKKYEKNPIYWLFDSGKKNGFKCLIYIHRYKTDTLARIRTDYVHEQQSRYRTAIETLENHINNATSSEKVKLSKQLKKIKEQDEELHKYEEKIHHLADQMISMDLDDGVKTNYEKLQDVLAEIR